MKDSQYFWYWADCATFSMELISNSVVLILWIHACCLICDSLLVEGMYLTAAIMSFASSLTVVLAWCALSWAVRFFFLHIAKCTLQSAGYITLSEAFIEEKWCKLCKTIITDADGAVPYDFFICLCICINFEKKLVTKWWNSCDRSKSVLPWVTDLIDPVYSYILRSTVSILETVVIIGTWLSLRGFSNICSEKHIAVFSIMSTQLHDLTSGVSGDALDSSSYMLYVLPDIVTGRKCRSMTLCSARRMPR